MKMYQPSDTIQHAFSFENFLTYYLGSRVVASESLDSYMGRVKDILTSVKNAVSSDQDKFVQETLNDRHEVSALSREVKYVDFRLAPVSRPEGFSGLYVEYLEYLTEAGNGTLTSVNKSIDTLKIAVASFINENQTGPMDMLYGLNIFREEKKVIDRYKEKNAKFFKAAQNKTKAVAQDVLRSMTDFDKNFRYITECAVSLNEMNARNVEQSVAGAVELIDALVESNMQTGALLKSEGAKKELLEAIDQTARAVEFYTALHVEFFSVCSAFKTLSQALKDHK